VGYSETQYYTIEEKIKLDSGRLFGPITVAYETYGKLNRDKNNAIYICHALSGDAHAAGIDKNGRVGWWDNMIGPGKAFDTNRYFVICSNVLGGCMGTTGPSSINPETGKPYGLDFPVITIRDMVKVQKKLIDFLGIKQLFAVAGGSMGGMQALQWCIDYPDMVRNAIVIAATARMSPQCIAFNEVGRVAIMSDPNWRGGNYYGKSVPRNGLALARMIGHITYLSEASMMEKFGRRLQGKDKYSFRFDPEFQVESYLHYKGEKFVERFDANSYLYITKAMDYFDLAEGYKSLADAFKHVKAKFLVISISSDWLYPPHQSREIVSALTANNIEVIYYELNSQYGHDAFLVETAQLTYIIKNFLRKSTVKSVMIKDVPILKVGTRIEDAAKVMLDNEATHIPIVAEDGTLRGIVTSWDICKAYLGKYESVDEIMTRDVIVASLNESIVSAAHKMKKYNISALPVVDKEGKVLGLVSIEGISGLIEPST